MSFSELRNTRQSKGLKSYVNQSPETASSEAQVSSSSPQAVVQPQILDAPAHDGVNHGSLYSSLPPFMELRVSADSGRGLWNKTKVHPGTVMLKIRPHVTVLSNQFLELHCSSCCGPSQKSSLKRCTQCRMIWYCGSVCQNRDWSMHKLECAALQKWASSAPSPELGIPSEAVRCLGRLTWMKQKKGVENSWSKEIDAMQSHRSSLPSSATEAHTHLAHSLVRYLGIASPAELAQYGLTSAGDLVDIVSRFTTNTFTLTSPSLAPLGVTVSPLVALINHSCDPNAVIVFPRSSSDLSKEPLMQLVALREIAENEEITTAYIDTTLPRSQRQKFLQETYNFDCQCQLCMNKVDMDKRESVRCPRSCGGMCPTPTEENDFTRCTKCKAVVSATDAILDAVRVGQQGLDKATALQLKDPAKAIQLTTNLIPILASAGLTPSSHPLLALTRLHQSLLISSLEINMTQDLLDETIQTASKAVKGLSDILHVGHPVRGLALAELGKMLAVDEPAPRTDTNPAANAPHFPPSGPPRLKMAYDTLLQARNELLIGFGKSNEGGEVGLEIRNSIASLEKEIGVWSHGIRNVIEDTPRTHGNSSGGK